MKPLAPQPALPAAKVAQLLAPRPVAVIRTSEDQTKFGGRLYRSLFKHAYAGMVYPINPAGDTLFGIKTYPAVDATPAPPDMVVVALPRDKVKAAIAAAAARPWSARSWRSRAAGVRLIGPNCKRKPMTREI